MCGIVAVLAAYQNGFTNDETKCFTDMLFADTLRGWDSTGVFSVDADGDVEIVKDASSGPDFIRTKEYSDFSQGIFHTGLFAVGHNRAATRGTIIDKNAHPFWIEDNIVLVQNGTWHGDHKHVKDTEVDTEALTHIIHEHHDDVEKALQKINAAYALIWYNVEKKTLYAIRNSLRPLYMAVTKQNGTLLASEIPTILFAAHRNDLQLKEYPKELEAGHLHSWSINDDKSYYANSEKVDYSFRGVQTQNYSHWPRHNYYALGYDEWDEDRMSRGVPEPTKDDITVTIGSHIQLGEAEDWEVGYMQATQFESALNNSVTKTFDVEFTDWLKCNYNKECNSWYIIGDIMYAEEFADKGPLVYSIFHGTEEEVMQFIVHKPFQRVKINSTFRVFNHKAAKYVVTGYATELEELVIETETEEAT